MPYLQYQAVMDSNTREEHAALNGVIRRIDDKFWDTYMPPNGWGCRCEAIQLPGSFYSETPDKDIDFPTVPTMFRINFGKQSLAFPPSHPYFKRLPEDQQHLLKEKSRQEIRRILSNAEQYKKLKQDNNYTDVKFNWTTGGLKATHKDRDLKNLKDSFEDKIINNLFYHGNKIILFSEKSFINGEKKIDGLLNNKTMEMTTRHNGDYKKVKDALNHCAKKKVQIAVINFPNGITDDELKKGLDEYYKHNQGVVSFKEIYIIDKNRIQKI